MIASPLRPRQRQEQGIAAAGRLAHQGTPYGASRSFATTTHLWPLSDPPSRKLRNATSRTGTARSIPSRALASSVSGSPCQGPGTGLPPPISTSVPGTPDLRSLYELTAIVAGQPRRDPQPKSLKLPVALQLRGPAARGAGSRWHDDLFRSCLHTSWDRPCKHRGTVLATSGAGASRSRDSLSLSREHRDSRRRGWLCPNPAARMPLAGRRILVVC